MLSRVANCLYWMSRYIERAENVARIVDVNLQLLLDLCNLDDERLAEHWMPIVESTGDEKVFLKLHKKATGQAVTEFLVFQSANTNSIFSSICQARENARMVRDQITIEFWEELNRLYLFVRSPEARKVWRQSPSEFFQEIKSASLHLVGIGDATILHNEGWWFSQAGKFIERADKTSRILDIRHGSLPERGVPEGISQGEALAWAAVLRSCSAWDAYKSLRGAEIHPRHVAEFLLFNEDFPRSARFCVGELNRALRRISGVRSGRFSNEAEKLCGRLEAALQFTTVDEIFEQGLHGYLDQFQDKLNAVGGAMFEAYICQSFTDEGTEMMIQQEEQQQQLNVAADVRRRTDARISAENPPPCLAGYEPRAHFSDTL